MRGVFVDPQLCIGCLQCEFACAVEHSVSREETAAVRERPLPRKRIHVAPGPVATTAFPNRCRHCDPAPCVSVCPSGAMTRDDAENVVTVEAGRCIGCAMCAVVCPFDVLTFHPVADGPGPEVPVAVKCDGCLDRVRRGEQPACVEVCKTGALVHGELNELLAQGRLRQSRIVLEAASGAATATVRDTIVTAWHEWGTAEHDVGDIAAAVWQRRAPEAGLNGHAGPGSRPDGRPATGEGTESA